MKKILNIFGLSILIIGFVFMSFPSKSLADTLALSFAQQFEGQNESSYSSVSDVVLDQEGNIYTTGSFSGTVDFDPSANTYNLTSSNDSSFISILSSDGSFIGAYQFENGENSWSQASSITLDTEGNIYTTGYFSGTVDFDPSGNTYNLTSSNSNDSSFISILASDGSFIGAYQFENGENSGSGTSSITLDPEGNIYTTGYFEGIVDFDPSGNTYNLTSNGSSFISILASDGSFIGAYQFENGENSGSGANSIALDEQGNIYTTGGFSGTVDFDSSRNTYNLTSSNDNTSSFISILASDGSFIGAYQFENGENSWSYARSITLDTEGNIYTTGGFGGTVDFDPSANTYNLTSSNGNDSSFISILGGDGSFIGAYQFENGENGGSGASSIALDTAGNIYTTGYFYGTVDFDPSGEEYNLNSPNNDSAFITKLSPQEDIPTQPHSHIKSSGSSVSTIAKFLQEQYQRALSVGMDATSYLQALNTYLQNHGL